MSDVSLRYVFGLPKSVYVNLTTFSFGFDHNLNIYKPGLNMSKLLYQVYPFL